MSELEECRRALELSGKTNLSLMKAVEELRAELVAEREKTARTRLYATAHLKLEAAEAERDALRAALKPFAALWDTEETYRIGGLYSLRVKYEDIKRARDALKGDGDE